MSASDLEMASFGFSSLYLWNMPARTENHPGFHMPGHAHARFFPQGYADSLVGIDTTELNSSDDLHEPSGPALLAMGESSRLYGSAETIFITTGSTTGIHVVLAAITSDDTFLLIPRTVHMSVLHALALFGIKYAFITLSEPQEKPSDDDLNATGYLYPQMTSTMLESALQKYPCATDILLVSPDYYGHCADLKELSKIAHNHQCRLIVDEAHGSHLAFGDKILPADAMNSGADICVQSLHKSLPALTMASQIHISNDAVKNKRISVARVWEMLRVIETSSPSFVIAASSEYAIAWMDRFGRQTLIDRIYDINNFIDRIEPILGSQHNNPKDPSFFDPMHLVLVTDPRKILAPDLMTALERQGIQIEFADLLRLVLIISPWQTAKDFDRLYDAICIAIDEAVKSSDTKAQLFDEENPVISDFAGMETKTNVYMTDGLWRRVITRVPEAVIPLRTAVFSGKRTETIDISQSKGRVCAVAIAPYPPGIAMLWPGERITEEDIELILKLINLGYTVRGMKNGSTDVFIE